MGIEFSHQIVSDWDINRFFIHLQFLERNCTKKEEKTKKLLLLAMVAMMSLGLVKTSIGQVNVGPISVDGVYFNGNESFQVGGTEVVLGSVTVDPSTGDVIVFKGSALLTQNPVPSKILVGICVARATDDKLIVGDWGFSNIGRIPTGSFSFPLTTSIIDSNPEIGPNTYYLLGLTWGAVPDSSKYQPASLTSIYLETERKSR